jgi:hypothetical protein
MLDINNKKEVVDYTISLYNKSKLWSTLHFNALR